MKVLDRWLKAHQPNTTDDIPLYEIVAEEIESGFLSKGAWAKAFAEANADKEKARALYLKLRVAQLPGEIAAFQAAMAQSNRSFRERLQDIARGPIPDMDHVPSENYDGDPSVLSEAIPITEAASMTGLLEFQVIDLIKLGRLRGVRSGENWFVDGAYIGEQSPPEC